MREGKGRKREQERERGERGERRYGKKEKKRQNLKGQAEIKAEFEGTACIRLCLRGPRTILVRFLVYAFPSLLLNPIASQNSTASPIESA